MASLLSGCQLIEQIQGSKQQPSTLPTSSTVELPAAQAQSLDAQFERIKKVTKKSLSTAKNSINKRKLLINQKIRVS